jgi:formamidopyrimidine-DNA glycosylase
MPELPEVETLAGQLRKNVLGRKVLKFVIKEHSVVKTNSAEFERCLPGETIRRVSRRGKYLCFELNERYLWFHLGMTGQLRWQEKPYDPAHLCCRIEFENSPNQLFFFDVRKFGRVLLSGKNPEDLPGGLTSMGAEPFDLDDEAFTALLKNRTGRIKSLLLNQHLIAGIGNIYADESLFRARISPKRRPCRMKRSEFVSLRSAICETLREAIAAGGSTIDDYIHTNGESGRFQDYHKVYGRSGKKCVKCAGEIRRVVLAGRSSFFCPRCQK